MGGSLSSKYSPMASDLEAFSSTYQGWLIRDGSELLQLKLYEASSPVKTKFNVSESGLLAMYTLSVLAKVRLFGVGSMGVSPELK